MTAKEYLKTYQGEKKEADAIEARIMELERKKKRVKAVSHTGVPGSRNRKDLSDAEVAIEELVESYMRVITAYITKEADILEKLDQIASGSAEGGGADIIINSSDMSGGDGGLFEQAVEFAIADGQISTSTLQRRLKIGYARAGRLTDEMEERGIVAAKDGSKPRKCLITREEWEEMKKSTEGMA